MLIALASAGLGGWWMRRAHRQDAAAIRRAAATRYEADADVAVHIATHEARSRGHHWLSSLHLLYGRLQDETVVGAIRGCGGDPDALEDRVLDGLDAHASTLAAGQAAGAMLAYALDVGAQTGRRPACVDLWAALLRSTSEASALCDATAIDRVAVLFRLFHGEAQGPLDDRKGDVDIVLRNDNYTTKEFVCEVLQRVFAIPSDAAITQMKATHEQGRTVVGRYRATDARAKVLEARRLATESGFPLWIGVEPAPAPLR